MRVKCRHYRVNERGHVESPSLVLGDGAQVRPHPPAESPKDHGSRHTIRLRLFFWFFHLLTRFSIH